MKQEADRRRGRQKYQTAPAANKANLIYSDAFSCRMKWTFAGVNAALVRLPNWQTHQQRRHAKSTQSSSTTVDYSAYYHWPIWRIWICRLRCSVGVKIFSCTTGFFGNDCMTRSETFRFNQLSHLLIKIHLCWLLWGQK